MTTERLTEEEELISLYAHRLKFTSSTARIRELLAYFGKEFAAQEVEAAIAETKKQRDELLEDIKFLAKRQQGASSISFGGERETGVSSNSIVSITYGVTKLEDQSFPSDLSDMIACENMWKKLPNHRKTGDGLIAMERARKCLNNTTQQ
jgi:hypothetical protein